ncbi:Flagellar motor switch/type III secretory pathway protein [Hahella chejuensis KCTC 2396]|uniref:Flagellar motor switch/type III secretory pathway protein n=1 Tax=Hahella chejuensis (strain KCTC 2396) TaxID=349521 RepID=Q2SH51_HAHCH|nr:type III secretion system cytoplasmic ring protein SctQ [Hahella chejuensis]ABC30023.1 Flagellar motor switch/type III secretory pathway protein [Hahella chejuensis KCTC 2396]
MTALRIHAASVAMQRLALPQVDPFTLRLQSLFPIGAGTRFELATRPLEVQFVAPKEARLLNFSVQLRLDQSSASLRFDQRFLDTLLSALDDHAGQPNEEALASLPFEKIPAMLQLALLQAALAPLIDQISAASGLHIEVETILPIPAQEQDSVSLFCRCVYGRQTGWASVVLSHEALDLAQGAFGLVQERWPRHGSHSSSTLAITHLPLALSAYINGPKLTYDELRQLQLNDMVLLPPASINPIGDSPAVGVFSVALSVCGRRLGYGTLQRQDITLTHINTDQPMTHTTTPNNDAPLQPLHDLPVEVVFEVARRTATLTQIQSLAPGQTIALDKPLSGAVTLLVQSQAIAEAELVQVGDQIGARITRLSLPPAVSAETGPIQDSEQQKEQENEHDVA